ncbi:MAG: hypothetical protein M5U31_05655 [Acidimicrobiia bacterium]|nr:hypothetical protein [Acidimicrobiia bacterium]
MPGGALIVIGMVLVAPVAIFLGGAVWSALLGQLLADDADTRAS